jgi:hypothetical protein
VSLYESLLLHSPAANALLAEETTTANIFLQYARFVQDILSPAQSDALYEFTNALRAWQEDVGDTLIEYMDMHPEEFGWPSGSAVTSK